MNQLSYRAEFEAVLHQYQLSPHAQAILRQTKLVLLTAATASGRNTIINELKKTGEYYFIVSDTTRQPRMNDGVMEQNGVEYWFRDEKDVLNDLKAGEFLEAEIIHGQQVSGMSIRELKNASQSDKIAITDTDIGGTFNVLKLKKDTLPVLVLPPSFEEWQRRIVSRGSMPSEEFKRRLETALRIFESGIENPELILVINDKVSHAAVAIHELATVGTVDESMQREGRALAQRLYVDTELLLKSI